MEPNRTRLDRDLGRAIDTNQQLEIGRGDEEEEKEEEEEHGSWRRRILRMKIVWGLTWAYALRLFLLLLVSSVSLACFTLPVEKILKDFLLWVKEDLGPWGPLVLAIAYIPLTILAVPASVLTIGGGYLFGLPVGFVADSIGATIGAGGAFLLGRTIARSLVMSKLKDYPKFRSVAVAIHKSGFKIVLLLRLVPLLPFNMLNYLLSVTPVPIAQYMLATWIGMMPITLALVYVGTTLKDLSDVTHGWSEFSTTRWVMIVLGFMVSVESEISNPDLLRDKHLNHFDLDAAILIYCVTSVAKSALDKALSENEDLDGVLPWMQLPPITLALVYVGTTLKDLSDVTHGWSEFSTTRWVMIVLGFMVSVESEISNPDLLRDKHLNHFDLDAAILIYCVTSVAKSALDKALSENEDLDGVLPWMQLPVVDDKPASNLDHPLIIKIDQPEAKDDE
ncbi:hypothetical protein MLD38_027357 [Melastoma candidum]|uniref:Uncharacterized protein n=1 Tax=Melastoma candidum TaxID=119954 RepID=A0ACB9P1Z1_9MYRT|nr:hypothetical protein MLD38_027357 [Melastoma candidum]